MITKFEVSNYGPIMSASCALTPLHAFIGPNDSGKSSLLRALVSAVNMAQGRHPRYYSDNKFGFSVGNAQLRYSVGVAARPDTQPTQEIIAALAMQDGARLVRFEADALRTDSGLVTEEDALQFVDRRGAGLPGVYDVLNNRSDETFHEISRELAALFPTVKRLRLLTTSNVSKTLAVDLTDGETVPASGMSEGMLYFLGYAALKRLSGVSLLAIEEPETGLHPARIAEVMKVLRAISQSGIQVVIATHSPLVVNEMNPDEVSIVTRTSESGTKVQRILDTPNFERRAKVYALGELWVSYANGTDEAPLLEGEPKQ